MTCTNVEIRQANTIGTYQLSDRASDGQSDGATDNLFDVAADDMHEWQTRQGTTTKRCANATLVGIITKGNINADGVPFKGADECPTAPVTISSTSPPMTCMNGEIRQANTIGTYPLSDRASHGHSDGASDNLLDVAADDMHE